MIEKNIYITLKTVFDLISKQLKVRQTFFAAHRIFNPPLSVLNCGETQSFLFDIFRKKY